VTKPTDLDLLIGRALTTLGDTVTPRAVGVSADWSLIELIARRPNSPPLHTHPWEEAFLVLDGELIVRLDGTDHHLAAGTCITVPGGVPHTYVAATASARVVVAFSSRAPIRFFAAIDGITAIDAVMQAAARHGVVPVGPPIMA